MLPIAYIGTAVEWALQYGSSFQMPREGHIGCLNGCGEHTGCSLQILDGAKANLWSFTVIPFHQGRRVRSGGKGLASVTLRGVRGKTTNAKTLPSLSVFGMVGRAFRPPFHLHSWACAVITQCT